MHAASLPIRVITLREAVASSAAIARSTLDQRKAERARRAAVQAKQSAARELAE